MLFKQLFEPESSTYTYMLACEESGKTLLIDPVLETVDRDLQLLQDMGLKLTHVLETHIHADHLTGALKLRAITDCKIAGPALDNLPCRDIGVQEGEPFVLGSIQINPLFTPGHTDHHHAYLLSNNMENRLFSGDALLIDSCGRTDFQHGSPEDLYNSIHEKFFTLPDDTIVFPCHDYAGKFSTTIGLEKNENSRIGNKRTLREFVSIMNSLNLPFPQKIDYAVPGNELCGKCPDNVPDEKFKICDKQG